MQYASLKLDDEIENSSVINVTIMNCILVTYVHTDYLSSHAATYRRQDSSRITKEIINVSDDPIQSFPLISHTLSPPPKNKKTAKNS